MGPQLNNRTAIALWANASRQLAIWKQKELELRNLVEAQLFADLPIGTHRQPYSNTMDLKLTRKETVTFKYDNDKAYALYKKLHQYYTIGEGNPEADQNAVDCMRAIFPSEIVPDKTAYSNLPENIKAIVNASGMVTIKDAQSSLELVPIPKPAYKD